MFISTQIKNIFRAAILISLAFSGCKKKDEPGKSTPAAGNQGTTTPVGPVAPTPTANQKALVEIYTGHQAGVFPSLENFAAAHSYKYHDSLIFLVIHAGYFSGTENKFPASYTTAAGNDWNLHFPGTNGIYPSAFLNRATTPLPGSQHWPNAIDSVFAMEQVLSLSIGRAYDPVDRSLNVSVSGVFRSAYENDVDLLLLLAEDSIVSPQKDYDSPGDYVENYVHNNVMRDIFTGTWGDPFAQGKSSAGRTVKFSKGGLKIDSRFRDHQLWLLAIATDATTRKVLQVEKVALE